MIRCIVMTMLLVPATLLACAIHAHSPRRRQEIEIGPRRELFFDRFLIDTMTHVALRLHRPVDRGPVLAFDKPWEGPFSGYVTIIHAGTKYKPTIAVRSAVIRTPAIIRSSAMPNPMTASTGPSPP